MLRCGDGSSFTLLLDGTVLVAGGSDCNDDGVCVATGAAELYVPAGVSPPPLPAFPSPPPPVFPSPTPRPTPLPPAAGPVPPNARSWKVTVDNKSSEPATLFVAEEDEGGMLRLVGSATPNVVPAGATVKVTFRFPADGRRMDLREPATGRRGIVGQRGPDRHPRQDPDHSGRPSGLVEPVAGKPEQSVCGDSRAQGMRWCNDRTADPFFDSVMRVAVAPPGQTRTPSTNAACLTGMSKWASPSPYPRPRVIWPEFVDQHSHTEIS